MDDIDELLPHEQRPGEPDLWYSRFLIYLNLGSARSFRKAYEAGGNGGKNDQYTISATWRKYIHEWDWEQRAIDHDIIAQTARMTAHVRTADDVWDRLYAKAGEAANTLVMFAIDGVPKSMDHQRARIQLQASTEVLDRLGFSKRAARPIYTDKADDTDKAIEVRLVGPDGEDIDIEAARKLAGYDNKDS